MTPSQKKHYIEMAARLTRDGITTVSIDVSVLVCHPFWFHEDLFYGMESYFAEYYNGKKSFYDIRIKAEKTARKKRILGDTTLADIYAVLAKKARLSADSAQKLMERETELEVHFAEPRRCGVQLLRDAVESGKRVILTCDTYLPEDAVKRILAKCGIESTEENRTYRALLISNSLKVNKDSGSFYPAFLGRFKLKPSQLIHVGSDIRSDVEMAISVGIEAQYLPSCFELMAKSDSFANFTANRTNAELAKKDCLSLRCAMAAYAIREFDFPM